MSSRWDPRRYLQFADHRLRPAVELMQRIAVESPKVVVDLGCGAGNVTRLLAERWPDARVVGVDHSAEMLAEARAGGGRVEWVEGDAATWSPEFPPDLIFSNATLHWLDDHPVLLPRLVASLAEGGGLAVQMPRSWSLPSHRIMREVLTELGAPAGLRRQLARDPVASPAAYHRILSAVAGEVDIWETEYLQELAGQDAVLEWLRGAGLRPVLSALADPALAEFLNVYRDRLRLAYPPGENGRTLFPFRRLFMVARTIAHE